MKRKKLPPQPGWALYMRTSSEEAQNPENSQRRQRYTIERALLDPSAMSVQQVYIDNLSGRYAVNRPGYQQLLEDARAGKFSHVAVENAERFGRNDTEALVAIDELHDLGVAIRFADYPDLDPIDPDDRIMVSLSFTLARRESIKLGQRIRGGHHAKLRMGGFVGRAPDGYMNCEERTETHARLQQGRYTHWVEQDPDRAPIFRYAWELLLQDRLTLGDICEQLHARGYRYRSGRPFVTISTSGTRTPSANTLSKIFHNWFYAGWVVSSKAQIAPKAILGQWQALVSTEEFERGLEILAQRMSHRIVKRRHDYLLKSLICVQLADDKIARLTGSTSNSSRLSGGTAYYCIPRSNTNILCSTIDEQIPTLMRDIQVDTDLIPMLRQAYTQELAEKLGHLRPSERASLTMALLSVDDEEARAARLFASGKITDKVWDSLWAEWQDRRRTLQISLHMLDQKGEHHATNLDSALTIIGKVGVYYERLARDDQKELLRLMVERVIVTPDGKICHVELLPPFAYLHELAQQARADNISGVRVEKTKTRRKKADLCSEYFSEGGPEGSHYVN